MQSKSIANKPVEQIVIFTRIVLIAVWVVAILFALRFMGREYADYAPVIPIGLAAFLTLFVYQITSQVRAYYAIDTLEEYLMKHPDCRTKNGVKCYECGSRSIRSLGVYNAVDVRRKHTCNSCGKALYRTKHS